MWMRILGVTVNIRPEQNITSLKKFQRVKLTMREIYPCFSCHGVEQPISTMIAGTFQAAKVE